MIVAKISRARVGAEESPRSVSMVGSLLGERVDSLRQREIELG